MSPIEAKKLMATLASATRAGWSDDQLALWAKAIADLEYADARAAVGHYVRTVEPHLFSIPSFRAAVDRAQTARVALAPKLEEPPPSPEERERVKLQFDELVAKLGNRRSLSP